MAQGRARTSGGLEREIIACLAIADEPMTPAQVQAEIGGDLAYTTVMTTLSRLYAKRALVRSPRGRAFAYQLVGDVSTAQASLTAHQMRALLEAGEDRASVLSRFVQTLDGESEQLLRELLSDAREAKRR
ncbi:BlaI/MecI/CopY family transcriptional regulator [Jatrophihabitans cynanchi]|jgi:predicted transcriptional regulator|uniref:BlaI/MecI/CopY family transcriptional regulator n=1 Tax=Jatrophihabitans cynanchi TaxID=2944128 RepID=A0ABY7K2Z7_9ACTN|nr:BlaI/MecI/CopY family transcriptional regulator [Jatrophihabitans sp. SB3-54]WAX59214.1 BlaI/MecI/CopY family transcriptional regulator [Jatrophihabitans sp. SB3-54]